MRATLAFLFVAALLAAPWFVVAGLGWDADAAILSNAVPATEYGVLWAAVAVTAHLVALLLAPMAVFAAIARLFAEAMEAWSPWRSGLSSEA